MVNYAFGKIYKLVDNTTDKIYIGSTCESTLARRLAGHVGDYKRFMNGKFRNVTSFEIIKNCNYDIILLELCPCESKDLLHQRERYYIETLECVNKVIVGRTRTNKEYYDDNKELISEKQKKYNVDNKDLINEKHDCKCGGKYTTANITKHFKTKKHQKYLNLSTKETENELKLS